MLDLFGGDALSYVVDAVADWAGVCSSALSGAQTDAALRARELNGLALLRHSVDRLMTDRAFCLFALRLVKDYVVAAVRALAAGQLVRADVDDVTAGTVNFFTCEEPFPRLSIASAGRTFNNKF